MTLTERILAARNRLTTHYETCYQCRRNFNCHAYNSRARYLEQMEDTLKAQDWQAWANLNNAQPAGLSKAREVDVKALNPMCRGDNHIFDGLPSPRLQELTPNWKDQWRCDCGYLSLAEWQECETRDNVYCPKCGGVLIVIPIVRGLAQTPQGLSIMQQTFAFCGFCGKYYAHVPKDIQPIKSPLIFPHSN